MSNFAHNRRRLLLLALPLVSLALGACSGDPSTSPDPAPIPPEPDGLHVRVLAPDETPVTPFQAIVSGDDGTISQVRCPSDEVVAQVACANDGLQFSTPGTIHVTIKARGYHFTTTKLTLATANQSPVIELSELPEFKSTDDFVTGFDTHGLEKLEQLSVQVPSELGPSYALKFLITDPSGSPEVYFQNTNKHPLHYDFAHQVLGIPSTRQRFEAHTYHGEDRTAMAGTVMVYPEVQAKTQTGDLYDAPICITFFPSDDLTPAQASLAHRLIEERLLFSPLSGQELRTVYLPAGDHQEQQAKQAELSFKQQGVAWMRHLDLWGNIDLQTLNPGTAFGTLRLMTPEQLAGEVVSFKDILVLTRLPNELPIVGGTITEELQTPLAHVNVAARSRGTPNIALVGASKDDRVAPFLGKLVAFEVKDGSFTLREATMAEAQAFWDSRTHERFVPPHDDTMTGLPAFSELKFEDAVRVGVKATNVALLSQLLGDKAPHGFVIPFHYYDEFMSTAEMTSKVCTKAKADCIDEGRTEQVCEAARALCEPPNGQPEKLWDHVARLLADNTFKTDSSVREAALNSLRYGIGHLDVDDAFAKMLDDRVAKELGNAKGRIRSSTNAEDLENFSGAGLYRSVSTYATGSKRASSRVRKVWASVWSWRAFEERSFWNIDHMAVRMGCAVHQAFPDEAANGVIITQNISDPTVAGFYANIQKGEVSVTNPEDGALPEVFSMIPGPDGLQVTHQRYSSLSPDTPLLSDKEINELFQTTYKVLDHFAPLYGKSPDAMALDMEVKWLQPDRALIIKQVRPYATASH